MQYRKLGTTDIDVSVICLGTMNWGEQNTEKEAHEQLDYAISQDINFIDTAEIYPIPPHEESQGRTETYIGNWLKQRGKRDDLIIASKVASRDSGAYMRADGNPILDKKNIKIAIEGSLKRLQTDYIDLYQMHWPDRETNYFGLRDYKHNPNEDAVSIQETLEALKELLDDGKIRYVGVSNETAWGLLEYIRQHGQNGLPLIQSIQNPYSLLMREYENSMAEFSMREHISLLVYSPLAHGVLTGKYMNGKIPTGSRFDYNKKRNYERYNPKHAQQAIKAYADIAANHELDFAQMSLAFVNSREFVTSNIIGATSMKQLKDDIASIDIELSKEVLQEIEEVHTKMPNPIT